MTLRWLSVSELTVILGTTPQAIRKRLKKALRNPASEWTIREVEGRGGRSGLRYEVLLSSLPEHLQRAICSTSEGANTCATFSHVSHPHPPQFIAAPRQSATGRRRWAVLRLIAETEFGTPERAQAVRDAARHHDVAVNTVRNWLRQAERHGWDMAALGRKRPADAGKKRVWISRPFDRAFLEAGQSQTELVELSDWFTRLISAVWQSPVQRAGWKRVRIEAITSLRIKCRELGLDLGQPAFQISRRRVEDLRYHRIVDVMENDAKRFDDMKPRIRRDNSRFAPMEQIVMDVKPLDCVLQLRWSRLLGQFGD